MKVVGLLSGGKDSVYSLFCAVKSGHELVAVAHVSNAVPGSEPDSYMYQSVASECVSAVAECLEVPLFIRQRTGTAIATDLTYSSEGVKGDEVEVMLDVLSDVRKSGIEFDGVVSGAIWSSYQKARVESVCKRLGVESIAPLWQRDQSELLNEMIESGVNAVLVKVACMGLGRKQLGQSLSTVQSHLEKLSKEFGANVCGEGGEFESLVLDCPGLFKHKRLVLDETEVVEHSPDPFAPVLYLKINKFHVEPKQ